MRRVADAGALLEELRLAVRLKRGRRETGQTLEKRQRPQSDMWLQIARDRQLIAHATTSWLPLFILVDACGAVNN